MPELPDDPAAFAQELQEALSSGGSFNPFALLSGDKRFHSVFIAPLSPVLEEAIAEFGDSGKGPLSAIVEQFVRGGLERDVAALRVRELFAAARGVLVVVLADMQGPLTVPQLFFGLLDERYRQQAVELCGKDFAERDPLRAALLGLERLAERGRIWPSLFVGRDGVEDAAAFWTGLARLLIRGLDEGVMVGPGERLSDLAHWIARALGEVGNRADGERCHLRARCHIAAGEIDGACAAASRLLRDFEVEDETLALLLERLVDTAIARTRIEPVLRFLDEHAERLDEVLGGLYELALPRFKARAAAMAPPEQLIAAADELRRADRKAFRHDLNREPLWRVAVGEPGELLDTLAAAELLERSTTFVAKRLEQGALPNWREGEELRIPRRGLESWKAVMDHFQLLD